MRRCSILYVLMNLVPKLFFLQIDVARTMVDDHLISSGYRKIFLNLMRDFKKDDHFSFDNK